MERLEESRLTERLAQTLYGTMFERARTNGLIRVSGDKDDRNPMQATRQFLLEFGSRHTRHGAVQDQTIGPPHGSGREESFCRPESLNPTPDSLIHTPSR